MNTKLLRSLMIAACVMVSASAFGAGLEGLKYMRERTVKLKRGKEVTVMVGEMNGKTLAIVPMEDMDDLFMRAEGHSMATNDSKQPVVDFSAHLEKNRSPAPGDLAASRVRIVARLTRATNEFLCAMRGRLTGRSPLRRPAPTHMAKSSPPALWQIGLGMIEDLIARRGARGEGVRLRA